MFQNDPIVAAIGAFLIVVASLAIITGLFKLYDVCVCDNEMAPDFDTIEELIEYYFQLRNEELYQQEAFAYRERINYVKRWWGEE
jgi:hypothetical protein